MIKPKKHILPGTESLGFGSTLNGNGILFNDFGVSVLTPLSVASTFTNINNKETYLNHIAGKLTCKFLVQLIFKFELFSCSISLIWRNKICRQMLSYFCILWMILRKFMSAKFFKMPHMLNSLFTKFFKKNKEDQPVN